MKYAPALLALPMLLAAVPGQVPVGHSARFVWDSPGSTRPFGVDLVDPATGSFQSVTGLTVAGKNVTGGAIDPATGELWLTGYDGGVRRVALQGTAAVSETLVARPTTNALHALALDRDGNAFVNDLTKVYRVERRTGTVTIWDTWTAAYPGQFFNGLDIDPVTNRMWAVVTILSISTNGSIIEWDIDAGPGPGTVATTVSFSGWFAPGLAGASFDGVRRVYAATGDGVRFLDLQTGLFSLAPGGGFNRTNAVAWDRGRRKVHAVGSTSSSTSPAYWLYDPGAFALQLVAQHVIDTPSGLDVNDFLDRTTAFPRSPSAGAGFQLEVAAHGRAGDLAGVALVNISGIPISPFFIGIGTADAGGFLSATTSVAPGLLPPGIQLGLLGVRIDGLTGQLIFGNLVNVTLLP